MIEGCEATHAITRPGFMQCAVCAAAGTSLTGLSSAFASGQESRGSREVMREFPYGAVRLTGGPIFSPRQLQVLAKQRPVDVLLVVLGDRIRRQAVFFTQTHATVYRSPLEVKSLHHP